MESSLWEPQPEAAAWVNQQLKQLTAKNSTLADFGKQLASTTGTRLIDWVRQMGLPVSLATEAQSVGFQARHEPTANIGEHPGGLFPRIEFLNDTSFVSINVDDVTDFCVANQLSLPIDGAPFSSFRRCAVAVENGVAFQIEERHGDTSMQPGQSTVDLELLFHHSEQLRCRQRAFDNDQAGFANLTKLIQYAQNELGIARSCDLFFAAEREYWQHRNRAAQVQKARQDSLGLGWGNHDHHTYRSSRECFADLIAVFELMGFECRERFYAGREAGWGAQVLEQPECQIVVFADVDLGIDEITGDFAHEPLPASSELGTVGLWCKLHGEAIFEAGMHHLECQFDFEQASQQLLKYEVETMPRFTDFPYLKQAFTVGERWQVAESRLADLLDRGVIDQTQHDQFASEGAIGSHLEILERNDGYKGFNQTGVSDIIRRTDPRL